jgi:hypothetical protein
VNTTLDFRVSFNIMYTFVLALSTAINFWRILLHGVSQVIYNTTRLYTLASSFMLYLGLLNDAVSTEEFTECRCRQLSIFCAPFCEISGPHRGEYEDNSLLVCSAVWSRSRSTFQTRLLPLIALMMKAVHTSKKLVYFNDITQRYIPERCHLHYPSCFWSNLTCAMHSVYN